MEVNSGQFGSAPPWSAHRKWIAGARQWRCHLAPATTDSASSYRTERRSPTRRVSHNLQNGPSRIAGGRPNRPAHQI